MGSPDYVLAKTEELIAQLPESFTLGQNYPNPFNPETNIPFTIAMPSYVQISIYNLLGQKVVSLESRWFDMGQYNVRWNGKDAQGNQLSTGVYIYSLESPEFRKAKKLILVK
ncbi:MAG: T9SS type A sorting domain-containing protein [Candidatus Marinimicrobia bacterium]|nr:T9SS type A sorting domain-containing protein [Candidatus Neomarinimicrobiota bacterium]